MTGRVLRSRKKSKPEDDLEITKPSALTGRVLRSRKRSKSEDDSEITKPSAKIMKTSVKKKLVKDSADVKNTKTIKPKGKENKIVKKKTVVTKVKNTNQHPKNVNNVSKNTTQSIKKSPKVDISNVSTLKTVTFKGTVPVDDECIECKQDYVVYSKGNDIYNAMLNQTNIANNNNKYFLLQLLKHKEKPVFKVWFRWGRVGKIAGKKLHDCSTLDEALEKFEKKFSDKTKNYWCDRHDFEHHPYKYELIHMDYGETNKSVKVKDEFSDIKIPESILEKELQALMKLIFDVKEFNNIVKEMQFDPRRSPLGKLTSIQIQSGYEILTLIENILKKKAKGNLVNACNQFYTKIPHDFGMKVPRVIRSQEEIKEKINLLEALSDIKIAMKMIEESMGKGNPLDSQYQSLQCQLNVLNKTSSDYKLIEKYVTNTHGATHTGYTLNIQSIFAINKTKDSFNKSLGNRYLLWHGSRMTNWCGILKQGLRIAPPEAPSTGYMFGKGVYFADMVSKSANYCCTSRRQPTGLLILCEVALGKSNFLKAADYDAQNLPSGTNSVKGVGKTQPDPREDVTMEDGVIVPVGKPTSTPDSDDSALLYNEYIVYNTDQVRPRYLVQLSFNFKSLW